MVWGEEWAEMRTTVKGEFRDLEQRCCRTQQLEYSTSGGSQIKLGSYSPGFYYHKGHFPSGASDIPLVRHVSGVHPLKVGIRPSSLPSASHDRRTLEKSVFGFVHFTSVVLTLAPH